MIHLAGKDNELNILMCSTTSYGHFDKIKIILALAYVCGSGHLVVSRGCIRINSGLAKRTARKEIILHISELFPSFFPFCFHFQLS